MEEYMDPDTNPKAYIYKEGIYLERDTARARRLTGEGVHPYASPETLAQKVQGLTADQAAKVKDETDKEWERLEDEGESP